MESCSVLEDVMVSQVAGENHKFYVESLSSMSFMYGKFNSEKSSN